MSAIAIALGHQQAPYCVVHGDVEEKGKSRVDLHKYFSLYEISVKSYFLLVDAWHYHVATSTSRSLMSPLSIFENPVGPLPVCSTYVLPCWRGHKSTKWSLAVLEPACCRPSGNTLRDMCPTARPIV